MDSKPYHFKPIDVAKMSGASVQTVRRWTELFASFLSVSANAAPGEPRLYTWADVEMFKQIKALRDQNVPVELISDRLSRPTITPSTVTHELAPMEDQTGPGLIQAPIVAHEYLIALERRLEAVEASKGNDKHAIYYVAVGFILALVFVILLLLLFLLRSYL